MALVQGSHRRYKTDKVIFRVGLARGLFHPGDSANDFHEGTSLPAHAFAAVARSR